MYTDCTLNLVPEHSTRKHTTYRADHDANCKESCVLRGSSSQHGRSGSLLAELWIVSQLANCLTYRLKPPLITITMGRNSMDFVAGRDGSSAASG